MLALVSAMISVQSTTYVPGVRGQQILDFLVHCDDEAYQRWWPGTHLRFRTREAHPGGVGNVVFMDEMIGKRRVRLSGVVTELVPGRKLVWQFKALVRLPVRLVLELDDDAAGVRVTHTIRAGFGGIGRILDPLFRLYLTRDFARAMDEHVRTEFPRLAGVL